MINQLIWIPTITWTKILEPMKCKNHKIHNTKEAKITLDVLLMRKTQKTSGKNCVAQLPKWSTLMNGCSTRYAQNPPSLVLSIYSCCPSSYYQLTLPSLFFNLVVRSTIELQLQSLSLLGWICSNSNDSQVSNNPHYTKEQIKGSDG